LSNIDERYEQFRDLIVLGQEQGYLLLAQVNASLAAVSRGPEEIENILSTLQHYRINVYEDEAAASVARAELELWR